VTKPSGAAHPRANSVSRSLQPKRERWKRGRSAGLEGDAGKPNLR
jgi:hypothetical protein